MPDTQAGSSFTHFAMAAMIFGIICSMIYRKHLFYSAIIMVFLLKVSSGIAQDNRNNTFGNVFLFNMNATEKANRVRQPVYFPVSDTAIYTIFDQLNNTSGNFIATEPASPVMLGVKLNPALMYFYSAVVGAVTQQYYSFLIRDSSDVVLVAMGINASNYKDFRYRVVENDSVELIPWSPVTDLRMDYGAKQPFAFIGTFNRPGKWIVVEVSNSKNYAVREGVVFDWRTDIQPRLEQVIVEVPGNYFNLAFTGANKGYATIFDSITHAPKDLRFPADSIRSLTFQLKKEETRVYGVHLIRIAGEKRDTLYLGMADRHGYFFADPLYFNTPGKYQLIFQRQSRYPEWNESLLLRIPFEVTGPLPANTLARGLLLALGLTVIVFLLGFWLYRNKAKKKMQQLSQQKEAVQLQLRTVRSQLNPHFIFNALASIQNLVNKQAITDANHYLSRFASLTRATLNSSEQDMISLEQEWKLADDYLAMEQLRFGFTYTLVMDEKLNPGIIDIPPLLLQPLIENAAKHGVAGRPGGHINVTAVPAGKTLQLTVTDNGPGFQPDNINGGFGLKLSRERIYLLNNLYPGEPFVMHIQSAVTGTTITITLNNWLP